MFLPVTNILVDNLAFCQQKKGLYIFAWYIMTNHVHMIVRAEEGYCVMSKDLPQRLY
jgi:REP element-mobilizing transposase RayT